MEDVSRKVVLVALLDRMAPLDGLLSKMLLSCVGGFSETCNREMTYPVFWLISSTRLDLMSIWVWMRRRTLVLMTMAKLEEKLRTGWHIHHSNQLPSQVNYLLWLQSKPDPSPQQPTPYSSQLTTTIHPASQFRTHHQSPGCAEGVELVRTFERGAATTHTASQV